MADNSYKLELTLSNGSKINAGTITCAQGELGPKGETRAAAGFGTPTATVDANVGTPSVKVTASGGNTAKVFAFEFKNLKGEKGVQGERGPQGETGPQGVSITGATLTPITT